MSQCVHGYAKAHAIEPGPVRMVAGTARVPQYSDRHCPGPVHWLAYQVETTNWERRVAWRFGRLSFAIVWRRRWPGE